MSKNEESVFQVRRWASITEKEDDADKVVHLEDELIAVRGFAVEPAKIKVTLGATLNMGNYESARVDVGIEMPCYREEIEDSYVEIRGACEEKVAQLIGSLRSEVESSKGKSGRRSGL